MRAICSEAEKKGKVAELKFKEWLDNHNIPYWYISQDFETFSTAMKEYFGSKRPDFMILVPNLGFIFVDVKYKKITRKYKDFPMDSEEATQQSSLQRYFNIQIWYAMSNEEYDYRTWFWIPVSRVLEEGKSKVLSSSKSDMLFFPIDISKFIQIAHNDSLDRLFSKCFVNESYRK